MMNYIWAGILLVSVVYAMFSGNLDALGTALTESSNEAVEFVIGLAGIMAMWSGLMEIAERTGLINSLSRLLLPFTRLLFPGRRDPETLSSIIMSFMANIFGAGNSSTVFALRTMEKLDIENHKSPTASNDMCMFAVVNMAFSCTVNDPFRIYCLTPGLILDDNSFRCAAFHDHSSRHHIGIHCRV